MYCILETNNKNTNPSQTSNKVNWRGYSQTYFARRHYCDTKAREGHYKQRKLQASILDENRCKNPQKNISKLSSTIHQKAHTTSEIHRRDANMFQHPQVNKCDKLTMKWIKTMIIICNLNRCITSVWQNSTYIHEKNSKKWV